jgi:hypothetical protein
LRVQTAGVLAVDVETPAVERADEARRLAVTVSVALAAGDRHVAVAAGVVERLHALVSADDDHRLAEVLVFDPVANVRNLLEPACHLPDVRP